MLPSRDGNQNRPIAPIEWRRKISCAPPPPSPQREKILSRVNFRAHIYAREEFCDRLYVVHYPRSAKAMPNGKIRDPSDYPHFSVIPSFLLGWKIGEKRGEKMHTVFEFIRFIMLE